MATKDGPVSFDLDADSAGLVAAYDAADQSVVDLMRSLDASVAALARATDKTNELREADKKLTEEEKKAKDAADKLKESVQKKTAAFEHLKGGVAAAGAGLTALGAVVVGTVGAFVEMARSVSEAQEELAGFVSASDRDRIKGLADGFEEADKAALLLKSEIATSLGPELLDLIDVFVGGTSALSDFFDRMEDIRQSKVVATLQSIARAGLAITTLGVSEALLAGFETLEEGGEDARAVMRLLLDAEEEYNDAVKEGERLAEQWAKEAEKGKRDAAAATNALAKAEEDAHNARIDAVEKGKELEAEAATAAKEEWSAYYEWLRDARLDDLEDQAEAASEYINNIAETQAEATKAWEEGEADKKAATQDAIQQILEAWSQAISDLIDMNLEAKQEKLDGIQEEKEATREQIADAQGQRKRDLEWHLEVLKFEEEEAKKAAQRAFALSQTAAVSEVIIAGAVSFVKLLAAFAPTGPLAPVLAGAVVAPVVATQLAVIAKNKPPAHSGAAMGADEFYVGDQMVRNGESAVIFNQRATERGAVDQAMAMNRDAGPMASQSVRLVLADAGRSISELAVRDAKRPGSAFGTPVRGFSDPHRRK